MTAVEPVKLTPRQQEVLDFLRDYVVKHQHRRSPTYKEIADHFGFKSDTAAYEHVQVLARKGKVAIDRGIARGILLNE